MTFLQMVILVCFDKTDKDRTTSSIYHMLIGKKSSQTIQDIHLYQLTKFFRTVPQLRRKEFDEHVNELIKNRLIKLANDEKYIAVTEKGRNYVKHIDLTKGVLSHIDGWKYHKYDYIFWGQLHLVIQTMSHLIHFDNKFIPIQTNKEIQRETKCFFQKQTINRKELAEQLYTEFYQIVENNFPVKPEVLILRLTGYRYIGATSQQVAELLQLEKSEYDFQFICAIHYMLKIISGNQAKYPILYRLIDRYIDELPYTSSTLKTKRLLAMGLNLETIAQKRNLKMSTIEDHMVEIALYEENFPYAHFMSEKQYKQITEIAKRIGTRKLSPIKEQVVGVTYFQIRLALARMDVRL